MAKTKYYRKSYPTKEENILIMQYLNEKNYDALNELYKNIEKRTVAICVMESGWKTLFFHNFGKCYDLTRKSLELFLNENGTYIVTENNIVIDSETFWNIVNKRDANPQYIDDEVFYCDFKMPYEFEQSYEYKLICCELFKIKFPIYDDFYIDNLRFGVFC